MKIKKRIEKIERTEQFRLRGLNMDRQMHACYLMPEVGFRATRALREPDSYVTLIERFELFYTCKHVIRTFKLCNYIS